MEKVISEPIIDALRAAGLADDDTRRVVIDLQVGHLPVVHIEKFGDERLIQVIEAVAGVEIVRA